MDCRVLAPICLGPDGDRHVITNTERCQTPLLVREGSSARLSKAAVTRTSLQTTPSYRTRRMRLSNEECPCSKENSQLRMTRIVRYLGVDKDRRTSRAHVDVIASLRRRRAQGNTPELGTKNSKTIYHETSYVLCSFRHRTSGTGLGVRRTLDRESVCCRCYKRQRVPLLRQCLTTATSRLPWGNNEASLIFETPAGIYNDLQLRMERRGVESGHHRIS